MAITPFVLKLNLGQGLVSSFVICSPMLKGRMGRSCATASSGKTWMSLLCCPLCVGWTCRDGALLYRTRPVCSVTNCKLTSRYCQYHLDPWMQPLCRKALQIYTVLLRVIACVAVWFFGLSSAHSIFSGTGTGVVGKIDGIFVLYCVVLLE